MATKTNKGNFTNFLSHKVKDYAEYRDYMTPTNSDHKLSDVKFYPAHLHHNEVVTWK